VAGLLVSGEPLTSRAINLDEVVLTEHPAIGRYAHTHLGRTPAGTDLEVGVLHLSPGAQAHPVHTHVEEELITVLDGCGTLHLDGADHEVRAGAITYIAPHVPHVLRNTSAAVLTYQWVKWGAGSPPAG